MTTTNDARNARKAASELTLVLCGIIVGSATTYLLIKGYWRRIFQDLGPTPLRFEEVSTTKTPPIVEPEVGDNTGPESTPADVEMAVLAAKPLEEQFEAAARFLRNRDLPRAARLVEEMAKHGSTAVPFLERLLRESSNAHIASCIIAAIAGISDAAALASLLSILRTNELAYTHKWVCAALEKVDDPRIVPALIELVREKNETGEVEAYHVGLLARKGGREAAKFFVEMLRDPTYDDVAGLVAVDIAKFNSGEELVQPLLEILHGMDFTGRPFTATTIAHALADIPDSRVGRGLTTLLMDETASLDNKQAIAEGAVLSGDVGALQQMLNIARFSGDPQVRYRALLALRLAGKEGVNKPGIVAYREAIVGVLLDVLRDADELARASACFSLGEVGDERAIPLLEQRAVLDSSLVVRREAKRALQSIRKRQQAETQKE